MKLTRANHGLLAFPHWQCLYSVSTGIALEGFQVDTAIKTKIDSFRAKIIRGEAINSIETPKENQQQKRIRELENELEMMRKQSKANNGTQETPSENHETALVSMLNELVKKSKESTFPDTCWCQLEEILFHVDKLSIENGKIFGIPLQTKDGKNLASILLIAGAIHMKRDVFDNFGRISKQSWLVFIRGVRNTNDIIRKITGTTAGSLQINRFLTQIYT